MSVYVRCLKEGRVELLPTALSLLSCFPRLSPFSGPAAQRLRGSAAQRLSGPASKRAESSRFPRLSSFSGPAAQRLRGSAVQRSSGLQPPSGSRHHDGHARLHAYFFCLLKGGSFELSNGVSLSRRPRTSSCPPSAAT